VCAAPAHWVQSSSRRHTRPSKGLAFSEAEVSARTKPFGTLGVRFGSVQFSSLCLAAAFAHNTDSGIRRAAQPERPSAKVCARLHRVQVRVRVRARVLQLWQQQKQQLLFCSLASSLLFASVSVSASSRPFGAAATFARHHQQHTHL